MGRQAVAVWQLLQGIASAPCGLRVLPRCGCGSRALLAGQESSSTQSASLRYRDVVALRGCSYVGAISVEGGATKISKGTPKYGNVPPNPPQYTLPTGMIVLAPGQKQLYSRTGLDQWGGSDAYPTAAKDMGNQGEAGNN